MKMWIDQLKYELHCHRPDLVDNPYVKKRGKTPDKSKKHAPSISMKKRVPVLGDSKPPPLHKTNPTRRERFNHWWNGAYQDSPRWSRSSAWGVRIGLTFFIWFFTGMSLMFVRTETWMWVVYLVGVNLIEYYSLRRFWGWFNGGNQSSPTSTNKEVTE